MDGTDDLDKSRRLNKKLLEIMEALEPKNRSADDKEHKALADDFAEEFLRQKLAHVCQRVVVDSRKSSLTAIPFSADYDLLLYYKPPTRTTASPVTDSDWVDVKSDGGRLEADTVLCRVQEEIEKAASGASGLSAEVLKHSQHYKAPLLKLAKGPLAVKIKISVCLSQDSIGSSYDLIAKPYPKGNHHRWRISTHHEVKDKFDYYNENLTYKLGLYKSLKWLRRQEPHLGMLPNYFYKNVILRMSDFQSLWTAKQVSDRFKDVMVQSQAALERGHLPSYFHREVNLLKEFDPHRIQIVRQHLKELASKDDSYFDLVSRYF